MCFCAWGKGAKVWCKLMSLTRYCPSDSTIHVKETSRPWVTVKLSNGARNSGCGSVCWILVPEKFQTKTRSNTKWTKARKDVKMKVCVHMEWHEAHTQKMKFKSDGCDKDYSILIQAFYVVLYVHHIKTSAYTTVREDVRASKMLSDCIVWHQQQPARRRRRRRQTNCICVWIMFFRKLRCLIP